MNQDKLKGSYLEELKKCLIYLYKGEIEKM
jgi:hypothetical protein